MKATVRPRWWVVPYCHALGLFAWLTGQQVDEEKLGALIARRGVKVIITKD